MLPAIHTRHDRSPLLVSRSNDDAVLHVLEGGEVRQRAFLGAPSSTPARPPARPTHHRARAHAESRSFRRFVHRPRGLVLFCLAQRHSRVRRLSRRRRPRLRLELGRDYGEEGGSVAGSGVIRPSVGGVVVIARGEKRETWIVLLVCLLLISQLLSSHHLASLAPPISALQSFRIQALRTVHSPNMGVEILRFRSSGRFFVGPQTHSSHPGMGTFFLAVLDRCFTLLTIFVRAWSLDTVRLVSSHISRTHVLSHAARVILLSYPNMKCSPSWSSSAPSLGGLHVHVSCLLC
ncbi:hypothetical protein C8R45DRAFT_426312 [Mycena sanguinolenta]|nr:hypothetical protein C8R45DRAFT_426312 [Mycena sanguinolenta]